MLETTHNKNTTTATNTKHHSVPLIFTWHWVTDPSTVTRDVLCSNSRGQQTIFVSFDRSWSGEWT